VFRNGRIVGLRTPACVAIAAMISGVVWRESRPRLPNCGIVGIESRNLAGGQQRAKGSVVADEGPDVASGYVACSGSS
jgi:hypothetical protein